MRSLMLNVNSVFPESLLNAAERLQKKAKTSGSTLSKNEHDLLA